MAILTKKKPSGKLETIGYLVSAKTGEPVAEIVSRKKTRKAKHTASAPKRRKDKKR